MLVSFRVAVKHIRLREGPESSPILCPRLFYCNTSSRVLLLELRTASSSLTLMVLTGMKNGCETVTKLRCAAGLTCRLTVTAATRSRASIMVANKMCFSTCSFHTSGAKEDRFGRRSSGDFRATFRSEAYGALEVR